MLAISSPMFSTNYNNFGWLLEDPISQQININPMEPLHSSSSSQKNLQHSDSNKFDQITINGGDHHQPDQTVKKLNHNASERDRRKKINGLYSSLRSLLPPSDHTVRRNLDQAKIILEALIKREEKKREVIDSEISLQRLQMKHKNETELFEDTFTLPEFPSFPSKVGSSEDEFVDSDDPSTSRRHIAQNITFPDPKLVTASPRIMRREFKRRLVPHGWLYKLDPNEPTLLFTKPLDPAKLSAAGIIPPGSPTPNGLPAHTFSFRGRMGRGGRIVFDRWNPLSHTLIECGDTLYVPPKARHSAHQ